MSNIQAPRSPKARTPSSSARSVRPARPPVLGLSQGRRIFLSPLPASARSPARRTIRPRSPPTTRNRAGRRQICLRARQGARRKQGGDAVAAAGSRERAEIPAGRAGGLQGGRAATSFRFFQTKGLTVREAVDEANDLLTAHPDITAIYGMYDEAATGAAKVLADPKSRRQGRRRDRRRQPDHGQIAARRHYPRPFPARGGRSGN